MNRLLKVLLTVCAVACLAPAASAQYMYLDSNGNGVHDTADRLNGNGTPTTVDLYVRTNQNRDGSTAVCNDTPATPLTINQYQINLLAANGTVSYSGFTNRQPTMTFSFGEFNPDNVRYKNGFGGGTQLAPGQYRLCTLTITGLTGVPRIDIVDQVTGSLDFTGFGTQCSGHAFDNVYRLDGPNVPPATGDVGDFVDWDGLGGAVGGGNNAPVLAAIGNKTVCSVGSTLTFTATATEFDAGQTLAFSLDPGAPSGATINGTTGVFSWTPAASGTFPVTIRVTDNGAPPLSDFEVITITVLTGQNPDQPPVLSAIGNKTANETALLTFTATAFSATPPPCPGSNLTFTLDAGAPAGAAINPTTGVFTWTPTEAQGPGTYPITVRVTTDGINLTDSETITVTVNETADPYIFLDSNGNGVHDSADRLNPNGTPTTVDLYIRTNQNRDGTTAVCNTGAEPLSIQSYFINLMAVGGTAAYSGFVNRQSTFTFSFGELNPDNVRYKNGFGNPTYLPPGQYRLCTLTITGLAGSPRIDIVDQVTGSADFTGFGTACPGRGFDNVYRLDGPNTRALYGGVGDFTDWDGLAVAGGGGGNNAPVLAPIGNKTACALGTPTTFTATATDPDAGQTLTFSLDPGAPSGATINAVTGAFSWTPQSNGTFPVTIRVTDNGTPPLSDFEAFVITTTLGPNTPPVLAAIGNKTVNEQTPLTFTATAGDPDNPACPGAVLTFSLDAGAPSGAAINGTTGVFGWMPTEAQGPGSYSITIRVTDNGTPNLSDFETFTVTVNETADPYMYLDSNGNGVHDTADRLNPNGTPTTVDLYVRTNQNRDGSTAVCNTGAEPLSIQSYFINLMAVGGTAAYSGFVNRQSTFTFSFGELNPDNVRYKNGFGNPTYLPPGQYRLCTLTITGLAGSPRIDIVDQVTGSADFTGFGTACPGRGFDNVYRLDGPNTRALYGDVGDFTDWDGLAVAGGGGGNNAPVLAPIGSKTACSVGSALTFTATATDPDAGQTLTFSLDPGAPSGATINGTTGVFSWTPPASGTFPVTIRVTDNGAPPQSDFEVVPITVPMGAPNQPPVLAAIGNKTVNEATSLIFTATASSPNPPPCPGSTITFSLDGGAPAGATINATTGVFTWAPSEAQGPGSYPITVRATDDGPGNLSDAETITVTVNEVNAAPVLAAIGNKSGTVGTPVTFTATATDPDIPPNTLLIFSLDGGGPPGATINPSTGAFSWTPSSCGTFPVTIRVTDNGTPALSDFEVVAIILSGCVGSPVLAPIGNKTVDELVLLTFTATATDPNPGATLTFTLDAGMPPGSTIQASTGIFQWIPAESQGPGTFPVTVRVTNSTSGLSDGETFTVTVREVNIAPVLGTIGNKTTSVGSPLAFTVTATDADIPANTLCFSLDSFAPPGATINCGTGAFLWIPAIGQLGSFVITVRVTDNGVPPLSDAETIAVTVLAQPTAPTADAGGPYTGTVNDPVSFDGTGSSDPNGDALTYAWNFGDGSTGNGATPSHAYTAPGTYNVTLRVTDPGGSFDEDVTFVIIGDQVSVALALKNGQTTLSLGKGDVRVAIEQPELQYTSVTVGSIRLSTDYPNAGTVSECAADTKHTRIGDLDHNGVPDLETRFSSACMSNLFRNVPNNTTVNLIITGQVQAPTGTVPLLGVLAVTIKKGGGAPVLVYPNPMNPQATLSFMTATAGGAGIQLFDLQGRLVRTLLPQQYLEAGAHEVTIDGLSDQGVRLSSGIYFYRVQTADGVTEGSISVLK